MQERRLGGHAPEQRKAMVDGLARAKEQGVEPMDDGWWRDAAAGGTPCVMRPLR